MDHLQSAAGTLPDRLPEPVLLVGPRGETLYANPAFRAIADAYGVDAQLFALFGPPARVVLGEASRSGSASAFLPLVVGDDLAKGYRLTVGTGENGQLVVQLADLSDEVEWRHQLFLRNSELSVLNDIGAALSATLEMDVLARRIWEQTGRIMDHSNFCFALHDRESGQVSYPIWVIDGRVLTDEHARPMQDGLIEHILTTREPLLLNGDVGEQLNALGITRGGPACLSFLGVPVVNDGEAVGVLALQDHDLAGRYGRHELGVLNIIATQAGAAVRNARLFSATRRAYEELSATQARLLESERLRGVTETVGALNHEVNNPLATLVGTAQLLLRREDLDELTRTRLERMLEAAKRIQTVTARMSTIIQATSRPYPGEDTILDVRASLAWMDAAAGPESAQMMRRDARGAVVAPPPRPDSQAA